MINWKYRKATVWVTILYSLIVVSWITYNGSGENQLHEVIVTNLLMLVATIIGGYVFGMVADNYVNGEKGEDVANPKSDLGKDNDYGTWGSRRKVLFLSLYWCAGMIGYLVLYGADTQLNRNTANATVLLAGAAITTYLFGVVLNTGAINSGRGGRGGRSKSE
jgi:MFS family permease